MAINHPLPESLGFPPGTVRLVSADVRGPRFWRRLWLRLTRRPVVFTARYAFEADPSVTSGWRHTTVYTTAPNGRGLADGTTPRA